MAGHDLVVNVRMNVAVGRLLRDRSRPDICDRSCRRADDCNSVFENRESLRISARKGIKHVVKRDLFINSIFPRIVDLDFAMASHWNFELARMDDHPPIRLRDSD